MGDFTTCYGFTKHLLIFWCSFKTKNYQIKFLMSHNLLFQALLPSIFFSKRLSENPEKTKLESGFAQKHNIRTEIGLVALTRRERRRRTKPMSSAPAPPRWTLGKCPNPSKFSHAALNKKGNKQHEVVEQRRISRGSDKSQVKQCLGFGTADS